MAISAFARGAPKGKTDSDGTTQLVERAEFQPFTHFDVGSGLEMENLAGNAPNMMIDDTAGSFGCI